MLNSHKYTLQVLVLSKHMFIKCQMHYILYHGYLTKPERYLCGMHADKDDSPTGRSSGGGRTGGLLEDNLSSIIMIISTYLKVICHL